MVRLLIPLPQRDFDPSEVALSWRTLHDDGHEVIFATPDGQAAQADALMLSGVGLDPWGWLPGLNRLRLVGLLLRANRDARHAHAAMLQDPAFRVPLRWDALDAVAFDGLLLPGGHRARGMREYLENPLLQALVTAFFAADKPVAAICHGVLLAARSHAANGKPVLHGRRTTALTWALEKKAWSIARPEAEKNSTTAARRRHTRLAAVAAGGRFFLSLSVASGIRTTIARTAKRPLSRPATCRCSRR